MKTLKKLLPRLLLVVLLLPLFSGCHGAKERTAFTIPAAFDESRQYELTFWAKNDNNANQVTVYQNAVADFEKLYPNIKVNLRLYSNYGDIYNDVITNIATDTTPNVCITYPDHIATYMTGKNCVVPLDTLMTDAAYGLGGTELRFDGPTLEEVVPKFLEECKMGENYYALPYMRSSEACYVNKTYVEALGFTLPDVLTWDFIWQVSEAAMAKGEDGTFLLNGQKVLIPFIYKSTDNMMIQYLKQAGAGYSTPTGEILIENDTTDALLTEVARQVKLGTFTTFKMSGYPGNFINAGQCIFAVDSTAGATWMGPDAPLMDIPEDQTVDFEMAVYPVPQIDPEAPKMISQGPSVCIFNKEDPQEVLASWLFTQYLLTNRVQIDYSKTEGYVPVTLKAQNDPEYQDYLSRSGEDNEEHYSVKISATKLLLSHVEDSFVTPVFNGSASLRNAAGQLIEEVTKSVRRKKTVDAAYLEKLHKDITALYRLDQIRGTDASGPLPQVAVILLISLTVAWILMGGYVLVGKLKKRREKNSHST